MDGYDSGTFTFSVDEYIGDILTTSTTFKDVPTTINTTVTLDVKSGGPISSMVVDENGDGKNIITLTPKVGETVTYEPPAPTPIHAPAPPVSAGSISIPVVTPLIALFAPVAEATSSPSLATNTPEIATTTESIPQIEKKTEVPLLPSIKQEEVDVSKDVDTNTPQVAAVYEAAKQSLLNKLGEAVYTGLQWIWEMLTGWF
ncbi:MAG: hypothetical protein NTV60_01045 [Candidatus Kaiserbacteria bacterium]|nr:hypothetical protein [Candidatus Kaiserbacteria bacterium]